MKIYWMILQVSVVVGLLSCSEEQGRERPVKNMREPEVQRQATVVLISDSCAVSRVETAIVKTRKLKPEIGFNLYYSTKALVDTSAYNYSVKLCNEEALVVESGRKECQMCDEFLENLQKE